LKLTRFSFRYCFGEQPHHFLNASWNRLKEPKPEFNATSIIFSSVVASNRWACETRCIAQPVARAARTQPIIAAPMPLVVWSRLRLRKRRRHAPGAQILKRHPDRLPQRW
jgi:hypothetical protein